MDLENLSVRIKSSRALATENDYEPYHELLLWMDENPSNIDTKLITPICNGFLDSTLNPDYMYSLVHGLNFIRNQNPLAFFKEFFCCAAIIYPHALNWYSTVLSNGLTETHSFIDIFFKALSETPIAYLPIIEESIELLVQNSSIYEGDVDHNEIVSNGKKAIVLIEQLKEKSNSN